MYQLINAGPSPYGRKVAVALHEKGIAFETVLDLPWAEAHATRVHSPLEQLPILLPDDGEAVTIRVLSSTGSSGLIPCRRFCLCRCPRGLSHGASRCSVSD